MARLDCTLDGPTGVRLSWGWFPKTPTVAGRMRYGKRKAKNGKRIRSNLCLETQRFREMDGQRDKG